MGSMIWSVNLELYNYFKETNSYEENDAEHVPNANDINLDVRTEILDARVFSVTLVFENGVDHTNRPWFGDHATIKNKIKNCCIYGQHDMIIDAPRSEKLTRIFH
jgi:hypothetical protein